MFSMDTFIKDMQKLLLKKEKEYGQLKFISSRATEETSYFIDELLEDVTNLAKKFNIYNVKIFYEDDNYKPREIAIQFITYYNCFILNTGFSTQHLLSEDSIFGHLVGFWPTLSPYLFIQIIWHIKFEDFLIESLVHIPVDLCVDILEIIIRCINERDNLQDKRFIFLLISKLYLKCTQLHTDVISIGYVMEYVHQLIAHFQTLLDLVSTKFINPRLSTQEKYIQHGILIKYIIRCIKMCMCNKVNYKEINDTTHAFSLTYGSPEGNLFYFHNVQIEDVKSFIMTLNQNLIALLEDHIKQVDCLEFMEWAEVDDEENIMISLQRAIIIECHCFIEFMKQNDFLLSNEQLFLCLQQIVGSSNPEESILTLQELCDSITNGKLDGKIGIKTLIKYYKKWDKSVLDFISKNIKLLTEEELNVLLEYLHYMFAHTDACEEKCQVYQFVMEILIQQQFLTMQSVILQYVLRHFHDNRLVCLFDRELFQNFMENNINMCDEENLRIILIFVMLNPKEVLTTLVRVAMGSTQYRNVIFKKCQFVCLYKFLISRFDNENTLLIYLLKDAWLHDNSIWHYKQFADFMNDMFENTIITPESLLNDVYIPWLTTDNFNISNLLSLLMHMYYVLKMKQHTHKTNYVLLITQLIKKISKIRKCNCKYLRSIVNSLLYHFKMILCLLFSNYSIWNNHNEIIKVNNFVEPIDQIFLLPSSRTIIHGSVRDIIQNYERRCLATYQLLRMQSKSKMYDYVHSFELDQRALLRHMILHATEEEYENFAIDVTMTSWAYFGWTDKLMAYENILQITSEAMQLALVFTDIFPKDTFVSLLRTLILFCKIFSSIKNRREEIVHNIDILTKTMSSLKNVISETHGEIYDDFFDCLDKMNDSKNIDYFKNITELIDLIQSVEVETETSEKINRNSHFASSTDMINMLKAYQFVCRCIDNTLYKEYSVSNNQADTKIRNSD